MLNIQAAMILLLFSSIPNLKPAAFLLHRSNRFVKGNNLVLELGSKILAKSATIVLYHLNIHTIFIFT